MSFAGIKSLQREHGLPFVAVSNILHEQTQLARRHYRAWFMLGGIGLAIMLTSALVLSRPFASAAFDVAGPCACLCSGTGVLLARRRAQAPIPTAARAFAQAC